MAALGSHGSGQGPTSEASRELRGGHTLSLPSAQFLEVPQSLSLSTSFLSSGSRSGGCSRCRVQNHGDLNEGSFAREDPVDLSNYSRAARS